MKRRRFLVGSLIASAFVLSSIAIAGLRPGASIINSETPSYELTLSSFADASSKATDLGNPISFYKSGLTSAGANKVGQLSAGGSIFNTTKISGIKRIDVVLSSGSIKIHRASVAGGSDGFIVGTSYDLTTIYPNYFKIEAIEATVIDSIKVTYSCVDYQKQSEDLGYSLYVNGIKSDAIISDATKSGEGYDKQYKVTLDVYAGDVLSFDKNGTEFKPTANGDGNNAAKTDSRGYLLVNNTKSKADLYLKKTGSNYDVWLTGNDENHPLHDLQDAPILQAWNWSLSSITSKLDDIKNAGFKAIQISPMQYHAVSSSVSWSTNWNDLYRPWSLTVAKDDSSESVIGTKSELKTLAAAADAKGISIIMDVVLNHMDGYGYDSWYSADSTYESTIVSNDYRHKAGVKSNDSQFDTLMKSLGNYPDLDTWQPHVQQRALSLLKEYLDCGVKGFRLDAAKHIETPRDGQYADSFWPYVVNGAKRYAESLGVDMPYFYGEALGAGDDRDISWYYPYMSVTDGGQAYDVRDGVNNGNISKIQNDYQTLDRGHSVIWNESHDNYAHNDTKSMNAECLNKVYAIQAARPYRSSVYLARPSSDSTKMGAVGDLEWKSAVVSAANAFENRYKWTEENRVINNGCVVTARGSGQDAGAMIVNINNSNPSFEVDVPEVWNGTYKDLVTGKDYNVQGGKVTVSPSYGVCVLVPAVSHSYYVVGNTIFTGTSASWTAESGRQMTKVTGQNLAELKNVHIEKDAEVRIIKQYDDGKTPTEWFDTLGSSYSYVSKSGNNIKFNRTSTFSFYLNNEDNIYIVDEDPEESGQVTITFSVTKNVGDGNAVYIISAPNWNISEAVRLNWNTGNVWTGTITKDKNATMTFKFVNAPWTNPTKIWEWEGGSDRTVTFDTDKSYNATWQ